jgi:clan AA aspartic protease
MGLIYAELELINAGDIELARRHYLGEEEIKRMKVTALVDTGAYMLCINETVQEQLELPLLEMRKGVNANGEVREYKVVGPIELKFKNRRTLCHAMVLSGDNEILLGAIPLEDMDVLIHPLRQELIVNPDHPYFAQMSLKHVMKPKYNTEEI